MLSQFKNMLRCYHKQSLHLLGCIATEPSSMLNIDVRIGEVYEQQQAAVAPIISLLTRKLVLTLTFHTTPGAGLPTLATLHSLSAHGHRGQMTRERRRGGGWRELLELVLVPLSRDMTQATVSLLVCTQLGRRVYRG